MAMIGKVKRMHFREKKSVRKPVRLTSLSRNTVPKWLKAPVLAEPKHRCNGSPGKLTAFAETIKLALKADAHRPRHERRAAPALFTQIGGDGCAGIYLPFSQAGGALLFHLLSKPHEHTGVMTTSNLDFAEWSSVFGNANMTTALLDRLTHHCRIVETGNESHRFLHSRPVAKRRIKAREQVRRADKQTPPHEAGA